MPLLPGQSSIALKFMRRPLPTLAAEQAVDQERRRIARRLHDTSCQTLTGIRLMAELLARRLPEGSAMAGDLAELVTLICRAVDELQSLARELSPDEEAHPARPSGL